MVVVGLVAATVLAGCSTASAPAPVPLPSAEVTLGQVTVHSYRGSTLHLVGSAPLLLLHRGGGDFEARDAGLELPSTSATLAASAILGAQGGASSDAGVRLWSERFSLTADAFAVDFEQERADFTHVVTRAPGP